MQATRRPFVKAAGAAVLGAAELSAQKTFSAGPVQRDEHRNSFETGLFLDNQMPEATPGVSRRLHAAKKHLLDPVVCGDR